MMIYGNSWIPIFGQLDTIFNFHGASVTFHKYHVKPMVLSLRGRSNPWFCGCAVCRRPLVSFGTRGLREQATSMRVKAQRDLWQREFTNCNCKHENVMIKQCHKPYGLMIQSSSPTQLGGCGLPRARMNQDGWV